LIYSHFKLNLQSTSNQPNMIKSS